MPAWPGPVGRSARSGPAGGEIVAIARIREQGIPGISSAIPELHDPNGGPRHPGVLGDPEIAVSQDPIDAEPRRSAEWWLRRAPGSVERLGPPPGGKQRSRLLRARIASSLMEYSFRPPEVLGCCQRPFALNAGTPVPITKFNLCRVSMASICSIAPSGRAETSKLSFARSGVLGVVRTAVPRCIYYPGE